MADCHSMRTIVFRCYGCGAAECKLGPKIRPYDHDPHQTQLLLAQPLYLSHYC